MSTPNQILVSALFTARQLLNRYTEDLTPQEYLHRACAGGNTSAWIIGHLVLTERTALGRAGVRPDQLPPLPDGFEQRFSREPDAPKASDFGDVTLLIPLFNQHRDRLIEAVKKLPPETFDQPLDQPRWFGATVGELLTFLGGTHVSMHAGQISLIRRSMGKPPLI